MGAGAGRAAGAAGRHADRATASRHNQQQQHRVNALAKHAGTMHGGQQADQTEQHYADPLHDAQRAWLETDHMLQIQRAGHDQQTADERQQKQAAGS